MEASANNVRAAASEASQISLLPQAAPTATSTSASVHPKSKTQPRQIHRNRASYSCHSCRRRKIKCDKIHPVCGHCSKQSVECIYNDNSSTKSGGNSKNRSIESLSDDSSPPTNYGPRGNAKYKRPKTSDDRDSENEELDHPSTNSTKTSTVVASATDVPAPPHESQKDSRWIWLAECLERWYRETYQMGKCAAALKTQAAADPPPVTLSNIQTLAHIKLQLQKIMQLKPDTMITADLIKSIIASSRDAGPLVYLTPSEVLELADKHLNDPKKAKTEIANFHLGHLDIQEQGTTRYVCGGFWALHESEPTDIGPVLPQIPSGDAFLTRFDEGKAKTSTVKFTVPTTETDIPNAGEGLHPSAFVFTESGDLILRKVDTSSYPPEHIVMMKTMPSKSQSDILYKSFLRGFHPIVPIIHIPTFHQEYISFWERMDRWVQGKEIGEETPFCVLLFSVLLAGAISSSPKDIPNLFYGKVKSIVADELLEGTNAALDTFQFPTSPTTDSLSAFIIKQTCTLRMEDPLTNSKVFSLAMRVAQSMGIHRDGKQYGLSELECEKRRRIWWAILHLDAQIAIVSGLPPLGGGDEDMYDTMMVSELKDEYIGVKGDYTKGGLGSDGISVPKNDHSIKLRDAQYAKMVSPTMLFAIGKYEAAKTLHKILWRLSSVKPLLKDELTRLTVMVANLKVKTDELKERIARLPADEDQSTFISWARIMLGTYSHQAFVVLTKPFMKSTTSDLWDAGRKCVIPPCHSFLDSHIRLSNNPEFRPYYWYCPGTVQPLHATMVLLLDLYRHPSSPEAADHHRYVEQIFRYFVDKPNEEFNGLKRLGHRKEWDLLKRYLKRAYEKAGFGALTLDPVRADQKMMKETGASAPVSENVNSVNGPVNELRTEHSTTSCLLHTWDASESNTTHAQPDSNQIPQPVMVQDIINTETPPTNTPSDSSPNIPSEYNLEPPQDPTPMSHVLHTSYIASGGVQQNTPPDEQSVDFVVQDFNWNEWDLVFDNCAELRVESFTTNPWEI